MDPVSTAKAPPERRVRRDPLPHLGAPAMADPVPSPGASAVVPTALQGGALSAQQVLYLQRTVGNAATRRAIAGDGRNGPGSGGGARPPAHGPAAVEGPNGTVPRVQRNDPKGQHAPQASPGTDRVAFVREDGLNLREGAGRASRSLNRLKFGQRVHLLEDPSPQPGWQKVVVLGQAGYVSSPRIHFPPDKLIQKDPALSLIRVRPGQTFWGLVKESYGIQGKEGGKDQNINHFINAIRAVNKPEAFDIKTDVLDDIGNFVLSGRDATDTYLKAGVDLWIPSFGVAAAMDVGSGTIRGELTRLVKKIKQKLKDFKAACSLAGEYVPEAVARHAGEVGGGLLKGLIDFAKDAAKILAISTAIGALLGAVFGAGAGAIPGAEIGFEIGLLILHFYGLYMLIEAVLQIAWNLLVRLGQFVGLVWSANGDKKQLQEAGKTLADALGILVGAVLIAVSAYVLKKGAQALSKTKFAATVGETRLAEWLRQRQQMTTAKDVVKGRGKPLAETPGAVDGKRVVAEARAKDGTIKTLEDGRTVICRTCEIHLLEQEFAPEINSLAPDDLLRKRIDAAKSLDPAAKAKAEAQLRGELQDIRNGKLASGASKREFYDLDDAATAALGENATVGRRLGDIGPVKSPGARADLERLGYKPDDFRAVQYEATSTRGTYVITLFEFGGVYFGPHVSSKNF
jgi:hypothetical protein